MQIEKAQYTARAHTTGTYGLLSRFFVVFFTAMVSLAPTATVRAQQPAQTGGRTRGAVKALAATATTTQKEGAPNQLNTVQPDTATGAAAAAIRPFRVNIPQAALADLRRRIAATRWPDQETVGDSLQGPQLATMQALAQYWGTQYNWRKVEAKLNSLPQFTTKIDGVDIHFLCSRARSIELRSRGPGARIPT